MVRGQNGLIRENRNLVKMARFLLAAAFGLLALVPCILGSREQEELAETLLVDYNKNFAPDYVTIQMDINLLRIIDLDLGHKLLTLDTWLGIYWHDDRLAWDVDGPYGNLTIMNLPSTKVWIPDVTLYDSADGYLSFNKDIHVIVKQNGDVIFIPPVQLHNYCNLDNGDHSGNVTCVLRFGSWTYGTSELDISLHGNGWETSLLDTDFNPHWTYVGSSASVVADSYEGMDEDYQHLDFEITLHNEDDE